MAWLLAAAVLYVVRGPREPTVGPRTLELGPEPPAVANFLVSDFRVTPEAIPATLLDLAARGVVEIEQRGPEVYYCRLKKPGNQELTEYERRVVQHLERRSSDGVVPTEALTTGTGQESSKWWREFKREVVADAQRRGLSRDILDRAVVTGFTIAASVPAIVLGLLWRWEAGVGYIGASSAVLNWVRSRHTQRETDAGLAAAARWLGVQAELAENEEFRTHPPIAVEMWERHLSYGAALGVAAGAIRPFAMGPESDRQAWSGYGGRWRLVRIKYSGRFPLGWGKHPLVALFWGVAWAAVAGFALYLVAQAAFDAVELDGRDALALAAILVVPSVAALAAIRLIVRAVADLWSTEEVAGQILRLRAIGSEGSQKHHVALDDGAATSVRAWVVKPELYSTLRQGQLVRASVTRSLRFVRSIRAA